jgi:hypothetical protein
MTTAANTTVKQRGRPFRKGESGNPGGRPEGSRNNATLVAERLLQTDFEDVCNAVVAAAKKGDMTAAKIIVERLVPLRKGRPVNFHLPLIKGASDVAKALGSVAQAMAEGELTPDEANTVASVLEAQRRAVETTDLEARVAALEAKSPK